MIRQILHIGRHKWAGTNEFEVHYIDAFPYPVQRLTCECGAKTWEMTRDAFIWYTTGELPR